MGWFLLFRTKPLQILFLKLCRKIRKWLLKLNFWSNSRKKHSKIQLWRFDTEKDNFSFWSIARNDLTCRKTQGDRFFVGSALWSEEWKVEKWNPHVLLIKSSLMLVDAFFVGLSLLSYDSLRPLSHLGCMGRGLASSQHRASHSKPMVWICLQLWFSSVSYIFMAINCVTPSIFPYLMIYPRHVSQEKTMVKSSILNHISICIYIYAHTFHWVVHSIPLYLHSKYVSIHILKNGNYW